MKHLIIATLVIFYITSSFSQSHDRLKGIEKELNEILAYTKAPGFAIAVVDRDKVIYAKGFGYRDYENKIPADANTLFAIGSSSKAFTSAILGQLRNEGKLTFEDQPRKYVPELKFFNDELNNNVMIKDLMCHRTGLPRHDLSWYFFPTFDKDSLLQRVAYHEPFTGVREQWYYNNFMFLAQGVIAERITEKSWEDNIKERFFRPLGMTRSNLNIKELEASTNVAYGYQLEKDSLISKMDYYKIAGMSPAGSINSSVNEMANWLKIWINKGKFEGEQILPEAYIKEAMSSHMVVAPSLPDDEFPDMHLGNYGYGWFISSYRGHYRVEHGGNINGFSANVSFFPSDSIGIVVLANQNGSAVPSLVRNIVADRILEADKTDWGKRYEDRKEKSRKDRDEALEELTSSKVENTKPSHVLQEFTGNYSNPGYGDFSIELRHDSLVANFKLLDFYLKHYHYDIFEPVEINGASLGNDAFSSLRFNFKTNSSGEISSVGINIEPTLDPIEFDREPSEIAVAKETLQQYVGEYELAGTAVKVYTKNENTLYLFVEGQPEYELIATGEHEFIFKIVDGFKVIFSSEDGELMNTATLVQPNGTFKAKRKE